MKTENSVLINRRPAEVFATISNLENMSHYEAFSMAAEKTSQGPIGLGTEFEVTGKLLFWKIRTKLQIVTWQPAQAFTIRTVSSPVSAQTKYVFERVGGQTRLTLTDETHFGGWFKFLEPLLKSYSHKRFRKDMNNMKAYLEGEARSNAS